MLGAGGRASFNQLPWAAIALVGLIGLLGIYNLNSSAAAREPDLYLSQLAVFGFGALVVALTMIPDYRVSEGLAFPVYAIVCLLLFAVLVQGYSAGGAQRWLVLGPVRFQPSELAKLAVIFCLARYFSQRLEPGGYSMRSLIRPMNPSRPIVAAAVLVAAWNKPGVKDPVGTVARYLHETVGYPAPSPTESDWFRYTLIALIVTAFVFALFVIVRSDRRDALLNPWPPNRRRMLIASLAVVFLGFAGALAWWWNAAFVRDPFGVLIASLADNAAPGGRYAEISSVPLLRVFLALAVVGYGLAAFRHWQQTQPALSDWLIAPIDLLALPALLILVEPDLGTAGIVILIGFTMILVVGVRLRSLIILALSGIVLAGVSWFGVLKDYQKRRILTFMDPEGDIQGAGWNAVQSMIAVGSGRFWGKGHREGTQTQLSFLPEQHTDFAFSVWAEEQGFFGCFLLLSLFLVLLLFALSAASEAREPYGALLATGVAAMIFWQAIINVGMVIGLMPVVGMTLPLFSYGGSSLLTVLLGLGVIFSVYFRRRSH